MPSYISELINDKTIIGACIGSTFSVIGAFVAYGLNLRLEKKKTRNKKIEELLNELEKLNHSILKNVLIIKKEAAMERDAYFESRKFSDEHINELIKPSSIVKVKLICKIHFKELIENINIVESKNEKYINFCVKARGDVYESKLTNEVREVSMAGAITALDDVVNEIKSLIELVADKAR